MEAATSGELPGDRADGDGVAAGRPGAALGSTLGAVWRTFRPCLAEPLPAASSAISVHATIVARAAREAADNPYRARLTAIARPELPPRILPAQSISGRVRPQLPLFVAVVDPKPHS